MKTGKYWKLGLLVVAAAVVGWQLPSLTAGATLPPQEIESRVASGQAVLVDVREPAEWQSGVAAPSLLLSLSDLRGDRVAWKPFLQSLGNREVILICRSGNRSGIAASILNQEGVRAFNGGSFAAWKQAGLPVRAP